MIEKDVCWRYYRQWWKGSFFFQKNLPKWRWRLECKIHTPFPAERDKKKRIGGVGDEHTYMAKVVSPPTPTPPPTPKMGRRITEINNCLNTVSPRCVPRSFCIDTNAKHSHRRSETRTKRKGFKADNASNRVVVILPVYWWLLIEPWSHWLVWVCCIMILVLRD